MKRGRGKRRRDKEEGWRGEEGKGRERGSGKEKRERERRGKGEEGVLRRNDWISSR